MKVESKYEVFANELCGLGKFAYSQRMVTIAAMLGHLASILMMPEDIIKLYARSVDVLWFSVMDFAIKSGAVDQRIWEELHKKFQFSEGDQIKQ